MRLVAGIVFYAASSKLEIDCDCQSTEKRSILWNAPSSVTLHATLHPLKRSILCNAPCSETPNQRMRRFRGFGVSRLIGISRSICKSEDAANGRIRQISRSASSIIWENAAFERIGCHFTVNLQITWCGNLHDRAFHARSTNERMEPFHATAELLANVSHLVNL